MLRVKRALTAIALVGISYLASAQTPGPEYLDRAKALINQDPRQAIELIDAVLALPNLPESVQLNARLMRATAQAQLAKQQRLRWRVTLYQGLFHKFEQPEQGTPATIDLHNFANINASLPVSRCLSGQLRLYAGAELHYQSELNHTDEHEDNTKLPSPAWSLGTVCSQADWDFEARFASGLQLSDTSAFNRANSISAFARNETWQLSGHYSLTSGDAPTPVDSALRSTSVAATATPFTLSAQVRLFDYNNQQLNAGLNAQLQGKKLSDYINYVYSQASGRVNRFTWTGGIRWPVPFDGTTTMDDGSKRNWWANAAVGWQFQPQLIMQTGWQYNYLIEQQYWISLTWQTR